MIGFHIWKPWNSSLTILYFTDGMEGATCQERKDIDIIHKSSYGQAIISTSDNQFYC